MRMYLQLFLHTRSLDLQQSMLFTYFCTNFEPATELVIFEATNACSQSCVADSLAWSSVEEVYEYNGGPTNLAKNCLTQNYLLADSVRMLPLRDPRVLQSRGLWLNHICSHCLML